MNNTTIRETMDQINIPENMQKEIINNLNRQENSGKYKYNYKSYAFKRTLFLAAALLLIVGTLSIPAQAGIRYLVKSKMESIPLEEMEATLEMQQNQTKEADSYSREYTSNEKQRMADLFRAYQKGTFPQGQLILVDNEEQIPSDTLCYLASKSCFYLPDRDLTDEEILEIIEFQYKRDYSLTLNPEIQDDLAEREEKQQEIRAQVQAEDGITDAEAVAIAQEWMLSYFNISPDGMEETISLDEELFEVPIYHIAYEIRSNCYYYFSISTIDGSIMSIDVSLAAWPNDIRLTDEQAKALIPENYQSSLRFLKEQIDVQDNLETAYCLYRSTGGTLISRDLAYFFQKADGNFYLITFCSTANEFSGFSYVTEEWFQQMSGRENAVLISLPIEN